MNPVRLFGVALIGLVAASSLGAPALADDMMMRGTTEVDPAMKRKVLPAVIPAGTVVSKSDAEAPDFLKRRLAIKLKRSEARVIAASKDKTVTAKAVTAKAEPEKTVAAKAPVAKNQVTKANPVKAAPAKVAPAKVAEKIAAKPVRKMAPKLARREPAQILVKEVSLQVSKAELAGLKKQLQPKERFVAEEAVKSAVPVQIARAVQVIPIGNDVPDIYTSNSLKAVEPTDDLYTASLPDAQEPDDSLYTNQTPAKAQQGEVTDIASAARLARDNSNLIKAFEEDANAAEAGVRKEEMGFLPTVSNTLAANYEKDDGAGRRPNSYNELAFNWPLYTGGQRRHALNSAQATLEGAEARRDATEGRVVGEVVDAFLRYVFANRIVDLLKSSEAGANRVVTAINAQREGGFASAPEVQAAKIELTNVRAQLADAETNLSKARDDVTLLAGRPVRPTLDVHRIERALSAGRDALLKKAMASNPRIIAATKDYEAATEAARSKAGRALPQVAASGNYRYDLDDNYLNSREEWNIGARVTVPLLDLATKQDTKQSMHAANASYYRALETKRVVASEFTAQWGDYIGAIRELHQAEARIGEQQKLVQSSKSRFDEGDGSLNEYLRRLGELKAAQITMEQLRARHVSNMARLLLTVGEFDAVFPSK
jgi:outer membrane protein, multidrug efflux system